MSDVSSPTLKTETCCVCLREKPRRPHQARGAVRGRLDVLDVPVSRIARPVRLQKKIGEADDRRQHVVEVVRDAAGEVADRLHLLSLRDAALEHLLLGCVHT